MTTLQQTRPLLLVPALLLVSACSPSVDIDVTREFDVTGDPGPHESVAPVDLSKEGDLWDNRDKVDAIHLDRVKAEIIEVRAGNAATTADFVVFFRPAGAPEDGSADVMVGAADGVSLALGSTFTLNGSSALNAFFEKVLEGNGQFEVHALATTDASVDVRVSATLEGSVDVKLF